MVIAFRDRREAFLMYGPEGVILKERGNPVRYYGWNEIEIINLSSIYVATQGTAVIKSNIIELHLSDNRYFELDPFNFKLDEFADFEPKQYALLKLLVVKCFVQYYHSFKKITTEAKAPPKTSKNLIDTYLEYVNNEFEAPFIQSFQDVRDAYYNGESFLFPGKPHVLLLLVVYIFWFLTGLMIFLIILVLQMEHSHEMIIFYVIGAIFFFALPSPMFLCYRYFIIVSLEGICFRKWKGVVHQISWNQILGLHKLSYGASSRINVSLIIRELKSINFNELYYNLKIFPKKQRGIYFFHVFNTYYSLSSNKPQLRLSKF